jgi:hypothetical protein
MPEVIGVQSYSFYNVQMRERCGSLGANGRIAEPKGTVAFSWEAFTELWAIT